MTATENTWLNILLNLLSVVVIVLATLGMLFVIVFVVLKLLNVLRMLRQPHVFLELTPPAGGDKTPGATQRLFSVLHGLDASRSVLERVLRRKVVLSLEVISTKDKGIRYVLRVPEGEAVNVEQSIHSYMPEVRCRRADDYMLATQAFAGSRIVEVKQTGHFAYPLHAQMEFGEF